MRAHTKLWSVTARQSRRRSSAASLPLLIALVIVVLCTIGYAPFLRLRTQRGPVAPPAAIDPLLIELYGCAIDDYKD